MLALATLVTVLAITPKPVLSPGIHPACPGGPEITVIATARTCPALDISGQIDANGAEIEPAFTTSVDPSELARFGQGDAVLSGFGADGHTIFVLPVQTNGPFHFFIPLAPQAIAALTRLTLVSSSASAERVAAPHGDPNPEVVSVDDGQLLIAWDAHAFPAIRISTAPGAPPIASEDGTSTFEQVTVASPARRLYLEFSDGIHTFARTVNVFGR
jgi:hypothetical protein